MPHPKKIEPVRIFSKQAENVGAQQKSPDLKIFDGRVERREPMLVPVYLARLDEPRARERTITEDVSAHGARVVTKRYWQRDEVPLLTTLIGEFPKHARVVYCDPQPEGGYCVGIKFLGPPFRWRIQCESKVFFPDDPAQPPQFSECPRQAETTRRSFRVGDPGKGEPKIVSYLVKMCAVCAKEWDAQSYAERIKRKGKAAGA